MEDKQMQIQSGLVVFFHVGFVITSAWHMGFCLTCHVWEGILGAEQLENNCKWLEHWQCNSESEFYISLPVLVERKFKDIC